MKFGYFTHVWGSPALSVAERYERLWRELELVDQAGFDYAFSVEHHCTPEESWMPSPAVFCTGAALRTENIRVGPMGWVPALRHPLHIVEEAALLDQILGGRLEVGLASGVSPQPFLPFGADFENRKVLLEECLDLLTAAFSADGPIDFSGPVHSLHDVNLSFGAAQRPHPPVWVPSTNRTTLRQLARIGAHTSSTMIVPRAAQHLVYRHYLDWWRQHDHPTPPNIGYWTLVHVAATDEEAVARCADHATYTFTKTLSYDTLSRSMPSAAASSGLGTEEILRRSGDFDFLADNNLVFVGSPRTVAQRIEAAAREGLFNTLLGEFTFGGLTEPEVRDSVELFASEVIPLLRGFDPY